MHEYAIEDARRGRDDPCTCGRGRTWKHCHGAETPVAFLASQNSGFIQDLGLGGGELLVRQRTRRVQLRELLDSARLASSSGGAGAA